MNPKTSPATECLTVDLQRWKTEAQLGELDFHKRTNFRSDEQGFADANARFFKSFGFSPNQFEGRTIVDLGAGSKMRASFFSCARVVIIEPLASEFIAQVPWCDLGNADEIFAAPAEQLIEELVGRADFLFSVNVLDHCYNFELIVNNIFQYLKVGGKAFLSFDCHSKVDKLHPLVLNEKIATQIFFDVGFRIDQFRRSPSYHQGIAAYSATFFMSKAC
jgi:2-polyprenyl-3-methyl-5-hydroxy-6-metoxy-1,4-benzoquinol methylase